MLTCRRRRHDADTEHSRSIGSRLALYWLCMALATLSAALFSQKRVSRLGIRDTLRARNPRRPSMSPSSTSMEI